jgi:hypothetical protein
MNFKGPESWPQVKQRLLKVGLVVDRGEIRRVFLHLGNLVLVYPRPTGIVAPIEICALLGMELNELQAYLGPSVDL